MQAYVRPWVTVLFGWFRGRRDLVLENAALRQLWGAIIPNEANPDSDHSGSNIVALQAFERTRPTPSVRSGTAPGALRASA